MPSYWMSYQLINYSD